MSVLFFLLLDFALTAVLRVPDDFADIKLAALAALPYDTIQISPGVYSGPRNCDIIVDKPNLHFVGSAGPETTVIDCSHQSRCISILGVNSSLSGLHLKNGAAPFVAERMSIRQEARGKKFFLRLPLKMLFARAKSIGSIRQLCTEKSGWWPP